MHTSDTCIARPLPQQVFLIAFVFSTRWFCWHPFFHCLGISNTGFNISVREASTSEGIGVSKQVSSSEPCDTEARTDGRMQHTELGHTVSQFRNTRRSLQSPKDFFSHDN